MPSFLQSSFKLFSLCLHEYKNSISHTSHTFTAPVYPVQELKVALGIMPDFSVWTVTGSLLQGPTQRQLQAPLQGLGN